MGWVCLKCQAAILACHFRWFSIAALACPSLSCPQLPTKPRLPTAAGQDRAFRAFSTIQDAQSRELSQHHTARRAKRLKIEEKELKLAPVLALDACDVSMERCAAWLIPRGPVLPRAVREYLQLHASRRLLSLHPFCICTPPDLHCCTALCCRCGSVTGQT